MSLNRLRGEETSLKISEPSRSITYVIENVLVLASSLGTDPVYLIATFAHMALNHHVPVLGQGAQLT